MTLVCALLLLVGEVVATEPLPRGTVLTPEMVEARGGADASGLIGRQLRRPVFAGRAITKGDVAMPDLVTRQASVTVTFSKGGLTLTLPGRAMGSGGPGDTVTVLIDGRRRPLRGVVTGPGTVMVGS